MLETVVPVLKWTSGVFTLVVGIWGLLSDPYEKDTENGRRRLNLGGWAKVGLLVVSFLVFGATDLLDRKQAAKDRRQQAQRAAENLRQQKRQAADDLRRHQEQLSRQETTIENQEKQLLMQEQTIATQNMQLSLEQLTVDNQEKHLLMQQQTIRNQGEHLGYLHELFLIQHQLSEIAITLTFSESSMRAFAESIHGFHRKAPPGTDVDPTTLAYISTACRVGTAMVLYRSEGRGQLEYTLNRPQGSIGDRFSDPAPEWKAFNSAFRSLFGERFEIVSDTGRVLADLLEPQRPMTIQPYGNQLKIGLREAGIRLDELDGEILFRCGRDQLLFVDGDPYEDERARRAQPRRVGPEAIQLVSRDPRVAWDQVIPLNWSPIVTRRHYIEDLDMVTELGEWHSGPNRSMAEFSSLSPD